MTPARWTRPRSRTTTTSRQPLRLLRAAGRPAVHADGPHDRLLPGTGRARASASSRWPRPASPASWPAGSPPRSTPGTGWWPPAPGTCCSATAATTSTPTTWTTGNLTLRAANLLAFDPTLELKQSIVPGFLTLIGTGKFLASSSGPVIFAEPPIRVDPQALVGWADCPSPSHHFDARWMGGFLASAMGLLGVTSGEERQFDFTGAGTVLLQSSERGRGRPAPAAPAGGPDHDAGDGRADAPAERDPAAARSAAALTRCALRCPRPRCPP